MKSPGQNGWTNDCFGKGDHMVSKVITIYFKNLLSKIELT